MQTLSGKSSFLDHNLQFSILQLTSWPALPDLLQETAPHLTRICALLARKPSVGMLIPVMLDMSPQITYSLLDALYVKGHICPFGGVVTSEQAVLPQAEFAKGFETPPAAASFLSKVWQRLMDGK